MRQETESNPWSPAPLWCHVLMCTELQGHWDVSVQWGVLFPAQPKPSNALFRFCVRE